MTNEQSKGHGGLTGDTTYAWSLTVKKSPSAASIWFSHLGNGVTQYQSFPEGFGFTDSIGLCGVSGSPDYWTVCYTDAAGNLWVTDDFQYRDSGPNQTASIELSISDNPTNPVAGTPTKNNGTLTFYAGPSLPSPLPAPIQTINLNFTVFYAANP